MDSFNFSKHTLIKFNNCSFDLLCSSISMKTLTLEASKLLDLGNKKSIFHLFNPYGITTVVILNQGQLVTTTSPLISYVTVDIFTHCADLYLDTAIDYLTTSLQAEKFDIHELV